MIQQNSRGSRAGLRSPTLHSGGLLLFLAAFLGCGSTDGLDRQAISGVVTLDGLPIMSGAILFEPATDRSGTAVGATVRKGEFTISKHEGPVPGRYRVRVYASSEIQAPHTSADGRTIARALQYADSTWCRRRRAPCQSFSIRAEFGRVERASLTRPANELPLRLMDRFSRGPIS
jgi:hypothetical protein